MAKWKIKEAPREGNRIRILLLRDGIKVGGVSGLIRKPADGPKFFGDMNILVEKEYQQEYMEAHNGLKMGEALGLELLKLLDKKGVSYIHPDNLFPHGERFIERAISTGIIEKTSGRLLRINWETMKKMTRKMRANEAKAKADARAAKIKKAREWVRRVFRRTRLK